VAQLWRGPQTPNDSRELLEPLLSKLIQPVEDPRIQTLEDHAIGMLFLPIGLWMGHYCPIQTYVVSVGEVQEFSQGELRAIVCDDGVRHPKSMDNICEEHRGLFGLDFYDGVDFDPLREFVDSNQ
jgi:hypothetical protein